MEEQQNRRSEYHAKKKKKYNQALNFAIAVVFMLVLMIGGQIVLDKGKKSAADDQVAAKQKEETKQVEKKTVDKEKEKTVKKQEEKTKETDNANEEGKWKPIGTSQSEPHVTKFEKGSTDWTEMEKAMSYATKLPEEQTVTWWIKNGGSPDRVIGYVSTKETKTTPFEVTLEWVPEKGWKPVNVEQLDHNPYAK